MKVLLDFRVHRGGAGRYGRELIDGLRSSKTGVEPVVHSPTAGSFLGRDAPFTPWGRRRVLRASRDAHADLVHGLHFEIPGGTRSVVTIQDVIPLDHPDAMPGRLKRNEFHRIIESSLREAARIIVPSELTRAALTSRGAATEKIDVIPLWISPNLVSPGRPDRQQAREKFAEGQPYVAAIWHERAHKNLGTLLEASKKISSRLVLLGRPPLEFLPDADLRSFLEGAEVFVMPSHLEGFGLPAAEALACGTPVVCGNGLGALPHLRAGALVTDVTDPGCLADSVERLLGDGELRQAMSDAGKDAALGLTLERAVKATISTYQAAAA